MLPIGDRIIGTVDPRTLSREEFEKSPDLLFHGAKEGFEFQRKIISGPNSQTVGQGFYTTDDRNNAELYSKIRNSFRGETVVISVLPYQARVLDLRAKSDPRINAPVPLELAVEYRDFIVALIKKQFPDEFPGSSIDYRRTFAYRNLAEHRSNLNKLIFSGKPIDLRVMLSLLGEAKHSEYGGAFFTEFMQGKGYDGLVYNEGGDHPNQKHTTSYVFYNLEKIGTFETWNQQA